MTVHQLQYLRSLLGRIKELYVEKEVMSALLDGAGKRGAAHEGVSWRETGILQQVERAQRWR